MKKNENLKRKLHLYEFQTESSCSAGCVFCRRDRYATSYSNNTSKSTIYLSHTRPVKIENFLLDLHIHMPHKNYMLAENSPHDGHWSHNLFTKPATQPSQPTKTQSPIITRMLIVKSEGNKSIASRLCRCDSL